MPPEHGPARGKRVDVGCARLSAIDAEVHQCRIIDQDKDDIGPRNFRLGLGGHASTEQGDRCGDPPTQPCETFPNETARFPIRHIYP